MVKNISKEIEKELQQKEVEEIGVSDGSVCSEKELVKRSSFYLTQGAVVWAKYDEANVYYPAIVRDILDPRSTKVKARDA